jgi:catechol 2,3-dioxygenase-like lactoylglutathione lyase family enzyme
MLSRVDRIQLAVRDRAAAEQTFHELLGAEKVREDRSTLLAARRSVLQTGVSELELLEPTGDGPVQEFLDRWGEGLLSAGFASPDLQGLAQHFSDIGVPWREEHGQVYLEPERTRGMRTVLTPEAERSPAGPVSFLYEVTNLVHDWRQAADVYARLFRLDPSRFHPIRSDVYGYDGSLLLFDPPARLDRIELAQTVGPGKAMGRFFDRRGESLYMAYIEVPDAGAIAERLERRGARWAGREGWRPGQPLEGLFIHPSALHGLLLGVSRTNLAWEWSGRPELARAARGT